MCKIWKIFIGMLFGIIAKGIGTLELLICLIYDRNASEGVDFFEMLGFSS